MKRILFSLIALVCFVGLSAQTVTLPTMAAAAQDRSATYQIHTTDYTLTATTVRYFVFTAPQPYTTTQDYVVNMDTIVGTQHTTVAVQLQGQKSPLKGDWANIGSAVTWYSSGADTTIIISNATANRYRNYRVSFTGVGTGATSKIDVQELKLFWQ